MLKYFLAAMGGTFDRLHKGHKTLIKYAFSKASEVYVGITNDEMARKGKKFPYCMQSYETRVKQVEEFAEEIGRKDNLRIVKLDDVFGPTLMDKNIDSLVCSTLTKTVMDFINKMREEKGLKKLPIEICELEKSEDGIAINSSRIRQGEINRDGFIYATLLKKEIRISEKVRKELKEPIGLLVKTDLVHKNTIMPLLSKYGLRICVGDTSSWYMVKNKIPIDVFIFDNRTRRHEIDEKINEFFGEENMVEINNPAGMVCKDLNKKIEECVVEHKHLKVVGEEDLAVIPAILYSPLESTIIYGQPDEGVVIVQVREDEKEWCRDWLSQ